MSYDRSFPYPEQKPWSSTSTSIEQTPLAPLMQSALIQSHSIGVDDFNVSHHRDITFNANLRETTTPERRYTQGEQVQSQRMKYYLPVPDRHVHMSPSNEYVTTNNGGHAKITSSARDSQYGQHMLQKINSGRDYSDMQQKTHYEIKPEITLQPIHGRQSTDFRSKSRRTFMMYKHELPEIIETETSSTADSSVYDDLSREFTTSFYKYRQPSGRCLDKRVKSDTTQVNGRAENVIPQYHPKYTNSPHETRAGTAVSYLRQTTPYGHRDDRKSFPMIEVAPGKLLRLRGAEETWNAIHNDFYSPCMCVCCEHTVFCIEDAAYVLCPECRVLSPLENANNGGSEGGVGLGFTMENLAKWQIEMFKEYEANHRG